MSKQRKKVVKKNLSIQAADGNTITDGAFAGSNVAGGAGAAPQGLVNGKSEGIVSAGDQPSAQAPAATQIQADGMTPEEVQAKIDANNTAIQKVEAANQAKDLMLSELGKIEAKSDVGKAELGVIIAQANDGETFSPAVIASQIKLTDAQNRTAPSLTLKSYSSTIDTSKTLEARALLATGANIEKMGYDAPTIEAAHSTHSVSLKGLISDVMKASGQGANIPTINDDAGWMKAAASTANLAKILGNIANKKMKQDFMENKVVDVIKKVCLKQSPTDFKTNTGVSLGSTGTFDQRGSGGRFEFADLTEDAHTFKVLEKGVDFGITRQMVVNDDLNMFMQIPQQITKLAMRSFVTDFHTLLADGGSVFFKADHTTNVDGTTFSNVDTSGAGVDLAGYDLMTGVFGAMKGPDGQPIDNSANFVLSPTTLNASARSMFKSTELFSLEKKTTKNTAIGNANPYSMMYEPLMSNRLAGATYYGITNPAELAAFYVSYLNGIETPTIFQWMENGTLDRMFTAVFDYGFDFANPQAAVRMSS